jgi:hypothetical protein
MTLVELALSVALPFGMVLDDADQEAQAINAARFYLGHGRIAALDPAIVSPTTTRRTRYSPRTACPTWDRRTGPA